MWIRMAFTDDECSSDEMPTLIAAYDQYTFESWGRQPDFYDEDVAKSTNVREVVVNIPDSAVLELFGVPVITGTVEAR